MLCPLGKFRKLPGSLRSFRWTVLLAIHVTLENRDASKWCFGCPEQREVEQWSVSIGTKETSICFMNNFHIASLYGRIASLKGSFTIILASCD